LTLIDDELSWAAFAELLTHAFESASVPAETTSPPGVMVLDAMAARGVPFKAMFLLGLNEKVFPRYIREDPFLRDRHRRVLEATLGYKVGEKLPGYDEEALLFTLLTQAAGRRLFLSFQRADEGGRLLAPSPYMTDLRQPGMPAPTVDVVPGRMTERLRQRPTMSRFLPPIDLAQWMAVVGRDTTEFLHATGGEAAMFRAGIEALARTEDEQPSLTAFDGLTGPLDPHWARITEQGCAPTPLERYARCPFRYFAADVLQLMPVRMPAPDEPDARVLGTFCHGALRRCYELLLANGWPETPVDDKTVGVCLDTAVGEASADVERRHRTGHYLLWEIAKARIAEVMTAAVGEDIRAYGKEPFAPVAFELAAEGAIANVPGQGSAPLKIRGRIDRLDRHRDSGALRIIDYKLKLGKSIAVEDRHLAQSAVCGYRLQPPFYTQLHLADYGTPREAQLLFLAPRWPSPVLRASFETSVWLTDTGTMLRETVGRLIGGIRSGQFFIVPETSCETCDFRVACRREHLATWWRAKRAVESKELAALRALRVSP
jgi:ATP-dependent helicase/nuclease subunit B